MAKHRRVVPALSSKIAYHHPQLYYQVEDADGRVRTFFETHPAGNRKMRRYMLHGARHSPKFTKPFHKGREWYRLEQKLKEPDEHDRAS